MRGEIWSVIQLHEIETIQTLNEKASRTHARKNGDSLESWSGDELGRRYTKEELRELRSQYRHDLAAFPGL